MFEVLDPTHDEQRTALATSPRLASMEGAVVGVISNGKQGTGRFFDAFAEHLQTHHGARSVERLVKPNYSAPAPDEIFDATQHWNALVSGIGD